MVKRMENTGLEQFEGIVESVEFEEGEDRRQYHVIMKPTDMEVGGTTGRFHEWIPMSPKCTEEIVPQQSVMDRYLQQMEICVPETKDAKTIKEAFDLLVGKKFRFKRIKLGKDFDGHPARDYFVPVVCLE